MRWSDVFVGRADELTKLIKSFRIAVEGKPQIVSIVAESGFGKTRLAQELYNWLSTQFEPEGVEGYWPDLLERVENNLTVNPDPGRCGGNNLSLPYLWWGIRVPDPGSRNEIVSGAMWPAVSMLTPHLARHKQHFDRQKIAKKAAKVGTDKAISIGVDVVGNVLSFGLLGIGKTAVETAKSAYDLGRKYQEIDQRDLRPETATQEQSDKLTDTIISDLRRLVKSGPDGLQPVPLVVLLDDAQWLDKDKGASVFVDVLIETARSEDWPLLLILTCWEREWRSSVKSQSLPAKWIERDLGDEVIMLTRARGLGQVIAKGFSGLTEDQVNQLLIQTDGNPRILDELLMYLDRNPKLFVDRDHSKPLSVKGEKAISKMVFSDFVIDRVEAAPEYVRRVLGFASLQGVTFSPNMTQRMALAAAFDAYEKGLIEGEDPFGFVQFARDKEVSMAQTGQIPFSRGEFRLRAYRDAAYEDLENHVDEEDAKGYFEEVRTGIAENIEQASNTDLEILMAFVARDPKSAFDAASELIDRAQKQLDTRLAHSVSEQMLPLVSKNASAISAKALWNLIEVDIDWWGPRQEHMDLCETCLALHRDAVTDKSLPEQRTELGKFYKQLGAITAKFSGPQGARPLYVEYERLMRVLADELGTLEARKNLANAVYSLAEVTRDIEGPEKARPLYAEYERLIRVLADELGTPEARKNLAWAVYHLAQVTRDIEGPEKARPLYAEYERLIRVLADELGTPEARKNLANAVYSLAQVTRDIEGPEKARPLYAECERLMRVLADELGTPEARKNLANAVYSLAQVTRDIEGPERARTYFEDFKNHAQILVDTRLQSTKGRYQLARDELIVLIEDLLRCSSWRQPFAMETAFETLSAEQFDRLVALADSIASYAQANRQEHTALIWLARGRIMQAMFLFKNTEYQLADELLSHSIDGLEQLQISRNQDSLELIAKAHWLSARVHAAREKHDVAQRHFSLAQRALDTMHQTVWNFGSSRALICWYHAKFLRSIGEGLEAAKIYEQGRIAAHAFAKFGARDSAAIVKVFEQEGLP